MQMHIATEALYNSCRRGPFYDIAARECHHNRYPPLPLSIHTLKLKKHLRNKELDRLLFQGKCGGAGASIAH